MSEVDVVATKLGVPIATQMALEAEVVQKVEHKNLVNLVRSSGIQREVCERVSETPTSDKGPLPGVAASLARATSSALCCCCCTGVASTWLAGAGCYSGSAACWGGAGARSGVMYTYTFVPFWKREGLRASKTHMTSTRTPAALFNIAVPTAEADRCRLSHHLEHRFVGVLAGRHERREVLGVLRQGELGEA